MGYKPKNTRYTLELVDYPGLEITCKGTSLGKILEMGRTNININTLAKSDELRDALFGTFADRLVTWNIEHPELEDTVKVSADGQPVLIEVCARCGLSEGDLLPTTVDGLMCLEMGFVMALILGWMSAVARVSGPKDPSINNGGMNSQLEDLMNQIGSLQNPVTSPMPS